MLRNGELVGEYPAAELGHNALIAAMVGRELAAAHSAQAADGEARAAGAEYGCSQGAGSAVAMSNGEPGHPPRRRWWGWAAC